MKKKRNKERDNFFKINYLQSWRYIKEAKKFIFGIAILFFISVIVGFLYQPVEVVDMILKYIEDILARTEGMASLELIIFIFFNNIQGGFFGMIFGIIFGIFPIIATFANGYIVGYVSSSVVSSSGVGSLVNLLPHGIFELPAIFISFGLGLKLGTFAFYKSKAKHFREFFVNSLRVFVFIVLPLLIIAAIIEGSLIFLLK